MRSNIGLDQKDHLCSKLQRYLKIPTSWYKI